MSGITRFGRKHTRHDIHETNDQLGIQNSFFSLQNKVSNLETHENEMINKIKKLEIDTNNLHTIDMKDVRKDINDLNIQNSRLSNISDLFIALQKKVTSLETDKVKMLLDMKKNENAAIDLFTAADNKIENTKHELQESILYNTNLLEVQNSTISNITNSLFLVDPKINSLTDTVKKLDEKADNLYYILDANTKKVEQVIKDFKNKYRS